jgi:hypothetical protein
VGSRASAATVGPYAGEKEVMRQLHTRIKRLEVAIMPAPDNFPKTMTICFVDSEKRVVEERVITFGEVSPRKRGGGPVPGRRRW